MGELVTSFRQFPVSLQVALSLLLLINLSLDIWALVDLVKRPVVLGGRKWVWALVIVFVSTFGALLYLVLGRSVPTETIEHRPAPEGPSQTERAKRAVDVLYGPEGKK